MASCLSPWHWNIAHSSTYEPNIPLPRSQKIIIYCQQTESQMQISCCSHTVVLHSLREITLINFPIFLQHVRGMVTTLRAGPPRNWGSIPSMWIKYLFPKTSKPISLPSANGGRSWGKAVWAWSWPRVSIQCKCWQCVEMYLQSLLHFHSVVLYKAQSCIYLG
jgi:hypothetical protein